MIWIFWGVDSWLHDSLRDCGFCPPQNPVGVFIYFCCMVRILWVCRNWRFDFCFPDNFNFIRSRFIYVCNFAWWSERIMGSGYVFVSIQLGLFFFFIWFFFPPQLVGHWTYYILFPFFFRSYFISWCEIVAKN